MEASPLHALIDGLIDAVRRAGDARAATAAAVRGLGLDGGHQIRGLAVGKAAWPMALGVDDAHGPGFVGPVVVPWEAMRAIGGEEAVQTGGLGTAGGSSRRFPGRLRSGERPLPADHPTPGDASAYAGLVAQRALTAELGPDPARAILLLSGGASSLMVRPAGRLSVQEVADATTVLMRAGADIRQLNAVRKHIESLKGGWLGAMCPARRLDVLVLSDVIGDPLDVIGSGPAAADPTTFADALNVLRTLDVEGEMPGVLAHLAEGRHRVHAETPKPGDPRLSHVHHRVLLNNRSAVEAAADSLRPLGVRVQIEPEPLVGDAERIAGVVVERAMAMLRAGGRGAIVFGGETTVRVHGNGAGGRNQHLALAGAIRLAQARAGADVVILTLATDGVDGVAPEGKPAAAGAVVTGQTVGVAAGVGLDARKALAACDSYGFFAELERYGGEGRAAAHLKIGATQTNLNDVTVALVGVGGA